MKDHIWRYQRSRRLNAGDAFKAGKYGPSEMFIKGVILSIALFTQLEWLGMPVSTKKPLAKLEKRKRGKVSRHR